MNALAQFGTASLLVLHLTAPVLEHGQSGGKANHNWDFGVWVARATGKENHNSFCEAQIFAAGVSVGRVVTDEIGEGWRRGHLEYIFNLIPVFLHPTPQSLYGGGFERMILRWN